MGLVAKPLWVGHKPHSCYARRDYCCDESLSPKPLRSMRRSSVRVRRSTFLISSAAGRFSGTIRSFQTTIFSDFGKMVKANNCNGFEIWAHSAQTGLSSSAFSTRYLMEHNANVATVGPANILRRRPKVNIYAVFRISKSLECVRCAFSK